MIIRILLLYAFILFTGCASVVSPDGGKKDDLPPVITKTYPDSAALNFKGNEIVFQFDEYFTLSNAQQDWVISPAPEKFPEIKKTNNQLKIKLLDSLKPNTTYTFNTSNSIADLNEGNVLKNYRFLFSTGNFIDSLQISGQLINAYSNQPQEEIAVMLFDTSENIYNGNPKYLTKTNKQGNYTFYNLPHSSFLICAWNDKNKNKKPEAEEDISIPEIYVVNSDTTINLSLISGIYRKQGIKKYFQPYPGVFSFVTEKPIYIDSLSVSFNAFTLDKRNRHTTQISATQDTIQITIPYDKDVDSVSFTITTTDTNYLLKKAVIPFNDTFKIKHFTSDIIQSEPLIIDFTLPISRVENLKIINSDGLIFLIKTASVNNNTANISSILPIGSYKLILPENAIKSIFNTTHFNTDTLSFTIKENNTTGSLNFIIKDTLKQNIIIELVSDYKTIKYKNCNACSSIQFKDIPPGTYQIKVVYDTNNNQTWDIGDISKSIKAEKTLLYLEQYKVKSNWQQDDIQILISK
jgi:uncharacterized protein (DUF2141 family)